MTSRAVDVAKLRRVATRHGGPVRAHAPGECERLSTLATLILGMKDLGDQADPQGLHRLSFATATDVAGLACWSAAQVPSSHLQR